MSPWRRRACWDNIADAMRLIFLLGACFAIAFAQTPTFDVASVKPTKQPAFPRKLDMFHGNAVNAKLPK